MNKFMMKGSFDDFFILQKKYTWIHPLEVIDLIDRITHAQMQIESVVFKLYKDLKQSDELIVSYKILFFDRFDNYIEAKLIPRSPSEDNVVESVN